MLLDRREGEPISADNYHGITPDISHDLHHSIERADGHILLLVHPFYDIRCVREDYHRRLENVLRQRSVPIIVHDHVTDMQRPEYSLQLQQRLEHSLSQYNADISDIHFIPAEPFDPAPSFSHVTEDAEITFDNRHINRQAQYQTLTDYLRSLGVRSIEVGGMWLTIEPHYQTSQNDAYWLQRGVSSFYRLEGCVGGMMRELAGHDFKVQPSMVSHNHTAEDVKAIENSAIRAS